MFYGEQRKGLNPKPGLTIHGNGTYYNLGTSLLGADIDGDGFKDLVIGSPFAPEGGPQRGSVAVFLAKTQRKPGSALFVHEADWLAVGKQNYGWFGYSMAVANLYGKLMLTIGAPTFRYIFLVLYIFTNLVSVLLVALEATLNFENQHNLQITSLSVSR